MGKGGEMNGNTNEAKDFDTGEHPLSDVVG